MATVRSVSLPKELLDSLPPDCPEARASRRDLRVFNQLLGNERWLVRTLRRHVLPGENIMEIGAGDGDLATRMIRRNFCWDGLDLLPTPEGWPQSQRWIQADLLTGEWSCTHSVIVANLVLHHFSGTQLAEIGARLQRHARVIVVSDLVRSGFYETTFGWIARLIGAHPVSRHDGQLSIRAGFRGNELSESLGLHSAEWTLKVSRSLTGAYRLVALKRA